MKSDYKYGLLFFIGYLTANYLSIMIIYSWTSFGGVNNMNVLQKIILFFFKFPSIEIGVNSFWLGLIINGIFWTLIFLLIKYFYNKIKRRKTA